ncbi:MAG TPA: ABC transporter ATP-binding protein [Ignavibacteriales bacterium]|nr:ABC transporter ATP-binding protein [Ignavibacteriales bacterium]HOL80319.1 ABC transporter ATP-binding protein [Ignavibacteriales bacterium]HOM64598.1 ABC transporter ATP-binding protein [Ignavibacteriales bacterium]HPD66695.1 ABC transporter ATP-binding protein [Ignavibacteriales bacterium]HPP32508.1 ABC transporter ATP-binding protein [Ignavibacteriales bacterium]
MIKIEKIKKSFNDKIVLENINLEIQTGESLAIIGSSGCGKSVLLKNIVGLLKPDEGRIFIDGIDITNLSQKKLYSIRQKFGFLFQGAALFDSITVEENIALPLIENNYKYTTKEIKKLVSEKLDLVKLPGIEKLKPSELSGGMKKRVGLARALITNPKYIFYDEPTTGLDPITSDAIDDLIANLNEQLKVTSIVVTHDMLSVKKISKRVVMLYNGNVHFDGSFDDLLNSEDKVVKKFINRTI